MGSRCPTARAQTATSSCCARSSRTSPRRPRGSRCWSLVALAPVRPRRRSWRRLRGWCRPRWSLRTPTRAGFRRRDRALLRDADVDRVPVTRRRAPVAPRGAEAFGATRCVSVSASWSSAAARAVDRELRAELAPDSTHDGLRRCSRRVALEAAEWSGPAEERRACCAPPGRRWTRRAAGTGWLAWLE